MQAQVLKGILKVQLNPLPRYLGGYGNPLGNKAGNNLSGFYKIKFLKIGIRVVYSLVENDHVMNVVVVSMRDDNQVYNIAAKQGSV